VSRVHLNGCELCGDADGTLFLRARCHITAPLLVRIEDGWIILSCYLPTCGREVARLLLARPEHAP
jgi:hypothetical protein